MLDRLLPYDLARAIKRVPLHLFFFGALGFGFEFVSRHEWYVPFVWAVFFGVWRGYEETNDIDYRSDTHRKAAIDFGSQFTGAIAGILTAWRMH